MAVDTGRSHSLGIRVFGASEVMVNGNPVRFMPKKTRWVFILLAMASARSRSLSRRELSVALWPFGDGTNYPVNRIMPQLEACLGWAEERISRPAAGVIHLDLTGAEFDLIEFRSILIDAVADADPAQIEAAVHMRPSRLLSDFPDGVASIEPERELLRGELFAAVDAIANLAREKGDRDAEIRSLAIALAENPRPDEERTRRYVEACEFLGKRDRAVWALTQFRAKGGSNMADLPSVERFHVTRHVGADVVNEPRQPYEAVKQSSSEQLRAELARAIDKEQTAAAVRRLLRQHPHLLAGSDFVHAGVVMSNIDLGHKSHADLACADFAYIEPQSGRSYVHVISFADPATRIFTEREEFTPQFHRATELLEACAYWIGRNQWHLPEVFGPRYEEVAGEPLSRGFFIPKCTLVIGRRSELSSVRAKEKLEARRGNESSGLAIRTYDGFLEEVEPTIRVDPSNERGIRCVPYESD